jgi:hypothetical protein
MPFSPSGPSSSAQQRRQRRLAQVGAHLAAVAPAPTATATGGTSFPLGRSAGWPQMVPPRGTAKPKLCIVSTIWRQNSHSEHMGDCFMHGWGLGGEWHEPALEVVSMYVDQDSNGVDRERASEFGFTLYDDIGEALRCGGEALAVDAVLIIGEHGAYTHNEFGQHQYPRYRFFKACTNVFKADGRSVPVFSDKHLSWKFQWAEEMVRESKELGFAFMAGSSLPVAWRMPAVDMPHGAAVEELMSVAYGGVDSYDFQ